MEHTPRFVSRLTRDTLAIILAGGRGSRLKHLTQWRAKPATPFGGKFRIIDFPLSNCINSGIRRMGVITQYKSHSLNLHIQRGWGFLRAEVGEFVELMPAQQRIATSWYQGTADAVYQNLDIIRAHAPGYILVLAGDHVYKMDFGNMIAFHAAHNADMTIGSIEVPVDRATQFGIMDVDEDWRVTEFAEKPAKPKTLPGRPDTSLASMGIYVFNAGFLYETLVRDAMEKDSTHDFGHDIIPSLIGKYRIFGFPFRDVQSGHSAYWRDVGTVDAYWETNLELVDVTPELNLYDRDWPIWTYQEQLPPAKFIFDDDERRGMAVDSMVSGGCVVSGAFVQRSLLFSNVRISSFSELKECVVLPDVDIGRDCRITKAILDRGSAIPAGTVIGSNPEEDAKRFYVTPKGVVLVTPEMLGQELHRAR